MARRRARSTPRLEKTLVDVGLECGGEPGSRLCSELGIKASGDTILRRLRATKLAGGHAGNIIGVDDFAFRRGQTYGTVIIDHESGGVIDLLPDRNAQVLEAWLAARPALPTVVTRDRSGVFAKAITTAAPAATQVADRWHLLANCREVLERVLDRHHQHILAAMNALQKPEAPVVEAQEAAALAPDNASQAPATPIADAVLQIASAPVMEPTIPAPPSKGQQFSEDRRAKRIDRYEQVMELHRQGHSQRAIIRQLNISRKTVEKMLNAGEFTERAKRQHVKQTDLYMKQLRDCWDAGVRTAKELTRHIRSLGYTGGKDMVRRCVASWRTPEERLKTTGSKPKAKMPCAAKFKRPSSKRLSWLLIKDDMKQQPGESDLLHELQKTCEPIRTATELARSFGAAIRTRDLNALNVWSIKAAEPTSPKEMNGFNQGLQRNWPEVKAAVSLPWSNGRTEGHVNRLKMIKRKMFGRANLDLLRIRVVGAGP